MISFCPKLRDNWHESNLWLLFLEKAGSFLKRLPFESFDTEICINFLSFTVSYSVEPQVVSLNEGLHEVRGSG